MKAYIELGVMGNYQAATDGTITIARWVPGVKPHEALAQNYAEIKHILADTCGFVTKPSRFFKFADRKAEIRGKCELKGAYIDMYADASIRFPQMHEAMGDGSLVTFYYPSRIWNEQERKDLARQLRERLPAGWYVMRAMPIENQATGKMEPQYLVSMGGQHRAFPLPPKPVFK